MRFNPDITMSSAPRQSAPDFTLMSLREEIRGGLWLGRVPGVREVAVRLKVSKNTVCTAYAKLVEEGWLVNPGHGRRLTLGAAWLNTAASAPKTVVRLMLHESHETEAADVRELLERLRRGVAQRGGRLEFCEKTQARMGHDREKILRCMEAHPDDLWIVVAARRELLEALSKRRLRVLALGGSFDGVPVPGVAHDAMPWMRDLVRKLVGARHSRIVHVCSPTLHRGRGADAFEQAMTEAGLPTGPYHLPEWDGHPESFPALLRELFRVTPPTALILTHAYQLCASYAFLSQNGLRVPTEVSLAVMETDPVFVGMQPAPAIMTKDWDGLLRSMMRWIFRGGPSHAEFGQIYVKAPLLQGGTLAPAPSPGRT